MTAGVPTKRRVMPPRNPEHYHVEVLEQPDAARRRATLEMASGKRCGCGLMLPHDPQNRVRSCTLPKEP